MIFLSVITVSSCTVEKRVHLPGYHVEWKTSPKKNNVVLDQQKSESRHLLADQAGLQPKTDVVASIHETEVLADVSISRNIDVIPVAPSSNVLLPPYSEQYKSAPVESTIRYSSKPGSLMVQSTGERLEVLGLLSMIFGIVGFLSFPFTWPLFGLAALILSILSFSKFSRRPDEFMGRGFAITGFVLSLVSLLLFLGFWLIAGIA